MKINSIGVPCCPVPEPVPRFKRCVVRQEERMVYGPEGKVVSTEIVNVSRAETIPDEEFENRGITCDLFETEVAIKAGVQLNEFTAPFYQPTFESRQVLSEQINSALDKVQSSVQGDSINPNPSE